MDMEKWCLKMAHFTKEITNLIKCKEKVFYTTNKIDPHMMDFGVMINLMVLEFFTMNTQNRWDNYSITRIYSKLVKDGCHIKVIYKLFRSFHERYKIWQWKNNPNKRIMYLRPFRG